jgi:HK97 family phage major capsid protein
MNLPFAPDESHLRAWNLQGGQRLQTRAPFQVGTAIQGGNLVATNLLADSFIEVLRNASVTAQLGARYLTDLVGKVDIPRQSGAASVSWVGESTAGSESEGTFDKVSLSPKTVSAWSVMSRLMMLQSTPSIEMIAREDLLAVAALALDLAAMSGSGSGGQPLGIGNQSGIGSVVGGTNGASLTFDHIIQLKTAPRVANASLANMAFALNSKSVGYLETLKSSTGQYLWSNDGTVNGGAGATLKGERYVNSQQLRSSLTKGTSSGICSELLYGNWRELLIGMWGVMEIAVNPYDSTGFKNGDVILRVMQTADVGVRHGASFAIMSDALTPGF